jgi:prolyl-tRNA synthetase
MKQSKYFLKTSKTFSEEDSKIISSRFLKQAGFIRESVAGRYYFLPIGQRVQQKIMSIVKEEMDVVGAQEMISPILHPLDLWKETNRTSTASFELMKVKDRRGSDFALGGTAEEMFVDLVRGYSLSYKDLPFQLYQFSPKFRDELRARGGLLRVREFIMKDGYSFHRDEEDFKKLYEDMKGVYTRIFRRVGLDTSIVASDNGYIGGEYCHEFVAPSMIGETRYFATDDGEYAAHEDVAQFSRTAANRGQEQLPLETITQPEWVQSMDDNEKHYKKDKSHFLKNVVYRNTTTGEIVIAVVTGDLEVNQTKLEHAINAVGQLETATEADLSALGTKTGFVHSWGHKGAKYVGDIVLEEARNLIGGQKENDTDTINVNYGRDFSCDVIADIAIAKVGDVDLSGKVLNEARGIEVGNIFQLGYHYSNLMKGAFFTDEDGTEKPYYMGCYGIGIGRTLAAIVEKYHDEKGIIWPSSVTPFAVHLVVLPGRDGAEVLNAADKIYNELLDSGVEVLYDDRLEVSPGEKFADSDLIGIPLRVVVSQKTLAQNSVELKMRASGEVELVETDKLIEKF